LLLFLKWQMMSLIWLCDFVFSLFSLFCSLLIFFLTCPSLFSHLFSDLFSLCFHRWAPLMGIGGISVLLVFTRSGPRALHFACCRTAADPLLVRAHHLCSPYARPLLCSECGVYASKNCGCLVSLSNLFGLIVGAVELVVAVVRNTLPRFPQSRSSVCEICTETSGGTLASRRLTPAADPLT